MLRIPGWNTIHHILFSEININTTVKKRFNSCFFTRANVRNILASTFFSFSDKVSFVELTIFVKCIPQ